MRKKLMNAVKMFAFLMVFTLLFNISNRYIAFHDSASRKMNQNYYQSTEEIDTLIIGASHAGLGIEPLLLNEILECNSHMLYYSGASIKQTYFSLLEAYKTQSPRVIIFEPYTIIGDVNIPKKQEVNFVNELKFSLDKVNYVWDETAFNDKFMYLFPILNTHANWKEPENIYDNITFALNPYYRGSYVIAENRDSDYGVLTEDEMLKYSEEEYYFDMTFTEEEKYWLDKIINLTQKHDSKIVVVVSPIVDKFIENTNYKDVVDEISRFVAGYDNTYFVDFNSNVYDLNDKAINFRDENVVNSKTGSIRDNQHCSYIGKYYTTIELKDFLVENDLLVEKESQDEFNHFNFNDYLKDINMEDQMIIILVSDVDKNNLSQETRDILKNYNIHHNNFSSGVYIIENGKMTVRIPRDGPFLLDSEINKIAYKNLISTDHIIISNGDGDQMYMSINNLVIDVNNRGIGILLYNQETHTLNDWAAFDINLSPIRYQTMGDIY